jgi:hypothetical protein
MMLLRIKCTVLPICEINLLYSGKFLLAIIKNSFQNCLTTENEEMGHRGAVEEVR